MLDSETKHRIDTARNILVGKVPDPKSQVEQITVALIYKFMDDMDAEAESLGGKRKFFAGDYSKYGWGNLLSVGLGGHGTLALYSEAIDKIPENPGIPALFRDIFKNAYLPYRDPETLRAFLKVINEFRYDHSERLGDAFEYLLSILGSQGDAGQFRTPRHIIDFLVELVNPQKGDVILDPACGTAGFLISAYKHIQKNNVDKKGNSTLTPDDKGRMVKNFIGYDISPDMVRLSLVNMYLHGFVEPHIYEYDTLTSLDRWNEQSDVILANPPFMSPKGGIIPHNRFSVQSKRSEVLFVDYIAEHLSNKGRAGIIVPEGIIFQSQTAYKQLRKMLVDDYLIAVVSLPAGVFNPYSGVKTSILVLDKALAKKSDSIAFFKVENDGYGLGAQRKPIDKNDLPATLQAFTAFRQSIEDVTQDHLTSAPSTAQIVTKEKISANGDYNLSGERYREGVATLSSWPFVKAGDVFQKGVDTVNPATLTGPVNYIGLEHISQGTGKIVGSTITNNPLEIKSLKNVFKAGNILYGKLRPNLNKVWLSDSDGICSTDILVVEVDESVASPLLYSYVLRTPRFNDKVMGQLKGAQLPRIGWSSFADIEIPLPPLDIQHQLVAEIESYQKVIDGARAVVENYEPRIDVKPEWEMVGLGDIVRLSSGRGLTQVEMIPGEYPVYGGNGMNGTHHEYFLENPNVAIGRVGAYCGVVHVTPSKSWVSDNALYISELKREINLRYLAQLLCQLNLNQFAKVGGQPSISQTTVYERTISVAPIEIQQSIVSEIEAEQSLVNANKELIERMEKKIEGVLKRVWGEQTT
ncbi:MAG: N-6 DNA methylase [Ignavibacteria bacterium]|nr:N-6 DNA methylase [Ignavibacteria bacterium]